MDLPESIAAVGAQLQSDQTITFDPHLLSGADVFAAERQRLFLQPWVAVDHRSRIDEPSRYVKFEAGGRSVLLTRDAEGRLHALRNVCIHAGYPVCQAEEGSAERLVCPYHGWEFAADGRLLEPDLSARIDPRRLRLASHPVCIRDGLIFVDLSRTAVTAGASEIAPIAPGMVPDWLAGAKVTDRARYATEWNWKLALQFVKSAPELFCEGCSNDDFIGFGPLSFMLTRAEEASLLRIVPKSAARTDIELLRLAPQGSYSDHQPETTAEALRAAGNAEAMAAKIALDRGFFCWYWALMSAG